jgi:alpha-glucosidase
MPQPPWWQSGVVYQIYPRSFADTDGDGIGDLEGIRRRLDHLAWLGVDAVWLSPIYRSPMADFGYDVADYCDIDPVFGTMADFDRLLADAHERDIRIVLDWVPNHTSDQHPWFLESRSRRDNPKRDWYVWRDPANPGPPPAPPNDWTAAFAQEPAWTFDERTGQFYLRLFLAEQPDLNWTNAEVREAMHGVLRFWLDRGVDGFRADVVHLIGKDTDFPDTPAKWAGVTPVAFNDHPSTHELLREIRAVLDSYPGDRMMVGEVNLYDHARIVTYYGKGDELHLSFNFIPLETPWDAGAWRQVLTDIQEAYDAADAWPTWVLSNHDQRRHRTRYGGGESRARAAAVLLLTLRGTPFLYAGEELGLEDAEVPTAQVVDPGGRDGCRAPIPWERGPTHGWAGPDPWLPWPPEPAERSAEAQRSDPGSVLHLYRRLLAARRSSSALHRGSMHLLDLPDPVLGYRREAGDDARLVLVNFGDEARAATVDGDWVVEVASDGQGEGQPYTGTLSGARAVVLR